MYISRPSTTGKGRTDFSHRPEPATRLHVQGTGAAAIVGAHATAGTLAGVTAPSSPSMSTKTSTSSSSPASSLSPLTIARALDMHHMWSAANMRAGSVKIERVGDALGNSSRNSPLECAACSLPNVKNAQAALKSQRFFCPCQVGALQRAGASFEGGARDCLLTVGFFIQWGCVCFACQASLR